MWDGEQLAGGLYGVAMTGVFFAESMFSRQSNGSKIALARLVQAANSLGFEFIDAQIPNPHLLSLGASFLTRREFEQALPQAATTIPQQALSQAIACDSLSVLLANNPATMHAATESAQ